AERPAARRPRGRTGDRSPEARHRRRRGRGARRLRAVARPRAGVDHGPARVRPGVTPGAARTRPAGARRLYLCDRRFRAADVARTDGRRTIAVPRSRPHLGDDGSRLAIRAMSDRASVVYVLPDKLGGMMNIVANLLAYRQPDGLDYHAVLTQTHLHTDARFAAPLAADTQTTVEYSLPIENLHAVMRRVARA